jgi:hypothetical protein
MARGLAAVSAALIGDVADVVGVDTLGAAPLIVDRSRDAEAALDRVLGLGSR